MVMEGYIIVSIDRVLRKMGFSSTTYNETILTIKWVDGIYTMPFGVLYTRGFLRGRVFRGSKVYEVFKQKPRYASLCVTHNPLLFYKAVFEKERIRYRDCVVNGLSQPCIMGCDACVFTVVENLVFRSDRVWVELKPIDIRVFNKYPRVFHRVDHAIVEALVYYTKIPFVSRGEACKYYGYILACRETVYRSSKYTAYRRIIDSILEKTREKLGESSKKF